jgi:hypothetical protein
VGRHDRRRTTARGKADDRIRFGSAITARELDALLAGQAARRRAGQYTPERIERQPDHPSRKKGRRR